MRAWTSPCAQRGRPLRAARRGRRALPAGASRPPPSGRHGRIAATGTFVVGADVPGGPRPRNVPMRAWASPCAQRGRPHARGAPRTSRPTSRRIPAPRRGGTGAWRPWGVCGRGRRPRRPASPGTSPCTRHERPRARSMDVPVRVPRARGAPRTSRPTSRRIPAPPPGRHGRMAVTGTFVVGADVPGGPRPWNVPMRAARRGRRALPTGASRSPLP